MLGACTGDDNEPSSSGDQPAATVTSEANGEGSSDGGFGSGEGTSTPSASNSGSGGSETTDPCSLVTKEEAEAALDKPVADGEKPEVAQGLICQFVGTEGTQVWQLQVLVTQTTNEQTMQTSFAAAKESVADANPEDVSGLGDEAFWIPDAKQLNIRQGRFYLIVSGDASLEALRDVAEQALDRL